MSNMFHSKPQQQAQKSPLRDDQPHSGYWMGNVDRVLFTISTSPSKTTKRRGASRFILFPFQLEQDEAELVVVREVGYCADSAFAWVC